MRRLVTIHEAVEAEINEAADFYDLENPGLGVLFIDEIQRTFENIFQFPYAAPLIQNRVRKKNVLQFPYSVIYSIRPSEIRILAVAHQKRRPFYWRKRQR